MTTTSPASMGGPLSTSDFTAAEQLADNPSLFALEASERIRAYFPRFPLMRTVGPEVAHDLRDADGHPYALPIIDVIAVVDDLERTNAAFESQTNNWRRARKERDAATARVGVLEGQLATARELHKPERRYTPDDGETSYATYAEAADASFEGTGTPVAVTFFEVCSHCASIEMVEGCDHQCKESLWPCEDAVALGLCGGGSDER